LNTLAKNLFLLLLLSSAFIFPACGSKEVKSEKASTTVLKSSTQTVAPPMIVMTATVTAASTQTAVINASSTHSYTKQVFAKHHAFPHTAKQPMMAAVTPLVSAVPTFATTAVTFANASEPTQKKSGSHWPLIVAGIALVAALGFYFWTKKAPPHNDFPLPPMGGLSPVGGFTAKRNKIQQEPKKESIWAKKLF
jgi:hypothetical protein